MRNITIRRALLSDLEELKSIGKQTFNESYSDTNSKESMSTYLENKFSSTQVESELKDKNSEFYFAIYNDSIVGYLKINVDSSQTESKLENALEIERIYVLASYYGQKIGQLLFEKALASAYSKKLNYIWLGVWEKNPKAIRFYQRNGFIAFDEHSFVLGEEKQTDIMMKLTLNNSI